MPGEQSVRSDEASDFRKILERPSPDSSSFRSELLSDLDSHKAHRTKTHRSSSHRRHRSHRDRDRDRVTDGHGLETRQLSRLLAHDEIESAEMRRVLIKTSERLELETRRANEAESRAREAEARALATQLAKKNAQAELMREQETIKAYQAQVETARNEILRAQRELDSMAAERDRVEQEAARDRSNARAMAKEIEIRQAREQGREEGKTQGFVDGRKEGWFIGTRDGRREALRELEVAYDDESVMSRSSVSPPPATSGHLRRATSVTSAGTRPAAPPPAPVDFPTPVDHSQNLPRATSTRTATPHSMHRRSGSLTQTIKSRFHRDPKLPNPPEASSIRAMPSSERLAGGSKPAQNVPSTSRGPGYVSPVPFNPPPSPRHTPTSPIPGGFIPLQENGRVSLPPPHEIDPPPPSPHSPAAPLPPEFPQGSLLGQPNISGNGAPTITVQEPTPPEPFVSMPEAHPAPAPAGANGEPGHKSGRIRARDYAFGGRTESPPLPPIPTERPKPKQRQKRGGGLQAPGRSSPSDTSTEFSQFEIVTGSSDPPGRAGMRGNGSKLSVIMEGGSVAADSPEPAQPTIGVRQHATPRMGSASPLSHGIIEDMPQPNRQGILDDPREYGDLPEAQLTPSQLAQRQALAEQLRWTPSDGEPDTVNGMRNIRDDVSIQSSGTRTSAPRRRPNIKMPTRLATSEVRQGASRDVEMLEKQAAMYDAFGTGQFPTFDSQSSPDEIAVSTRTPPNFRKGHRRAMSSSTSVPEITIQPPSRPSSHASKMSTAIGNLSPQGGSVPMPTPGTPRRHSMQGPPPSPSRIPLPQTTVQVPMTLVTPHHGEFTLPQDTLPEVEHLPPGFIPQTIPQPGPPEGFFRNEPPTGEQFGFNDSSKSNGHSPARPGGSFTNGTPRRPNAAPSGPSKFQGYTPAGVPLPLSTATTSRVLPDNASSAPRGTGRSSHFDLPDIAATSYEPAPLPPGTKYPPSFGPAGIPLPASVAGNSPRPSAMGQTPWGGYSALGAGATPGPSMPASLGGDRPMSIYAGDKKVSSSSLASLYKKFEPSTYLDPAYLASADSATGNDVTEGKPAVATAAQKKKNRISTTSVETVTDEDDVPRSKRK